MAATTVAGRRGIPKSVFTALGWGLTIAVMAWLAFAIRDQFWAQTRNGLTLGAIYAMIALGYTMVYGVLQLINFAHSEVFMIGTVVTLFAFRNWFGVEERIGGVGLIVVILGAAKEAIPPVMATSDAFSLFGTPIQNTRVLVILVALVMMVVLDRFVRQTRLGRGIRAVAQDAETASLMGVNIDRIVVATFLIGGLMAGAAGTLWGVFFHTSAWNIGFLPGIKAFTAAVLGGIGNIRGAMAGGILLGLVEAYGSAAIGAQWKDVIAFVVLVVVLMFRPTGLFGEQVGA